MSLLERLATIRETDNRHFGTYKELLAERDALRERVKTLELAYKWASEVESSEAAGRRAAFGL